MQRRVNFRKQCQSKKDVFTNIDASIRKSNQDTIKPRRRYAVIEKIKTSSQNYKTILCCKEIDGKFLENEIKIKMK